MPKINFDKSEAYMNFVEYDYTVQNFIKLILFLEKSEENKECCEEFSNLFNNDEEIEDVITNFAIHMPIDINRIPEQGIEIDGRLFTVNDIFYLHENFYVTYNSHDFEYEDEPDNDSFKKMLTKAEIFDAFVHMAKKSLKELSEMGANKKSMHALDVLKSAAEIKPDPDDLRIDAYKYVKELDMSEALLKSGRRKLRGSSKEYENILTQVADLRAKIRGLYDLERNGQVKSHGIFAKRYIKTYMNVLIEKMDCYIDKRENVSSDFTSYKGRRVAIMELVRDIIKNESASIKMPKMCETSPENQNSALEMCTKNSYEKLLTSLNKDNMFSVSLYKEMKYATSHFPAGTDNEKILEAEFKKKHLDLFEKAKLSGKITTEQAEKIMQKTANLFNHLQGLSPKELSAYNAKLKQANISLNSEAVESFERLQNLFYPTDYTGEITGYRAYDRELVKALLEKSNEIMRGNELKNAPIAPNV